MTITLTTDMTGTTDITGNDDADTQAPAQQLRLLDARDVPLQHRLDRETRQRGLAHVAEIRRLLAEQAARLAA